MWCHSWLNVSTNIIMCWELGYCLKDVMDIVLGSISFISSLLSHRWYSVCYPDKLPPLICLSPLDRSWWSARMIPIRLQITRRLSWSVCCIIPLLSSGIRRLLSKVVQKHLNSRGIEWGLRWIYWILPMSSSGWNIVIWFSLMISGHQPSQISHFPINQLSTWLIRTCAGRLEKNRFLPLFSCTKPIN